MKEEEKKKDYRNTSGLIPGGKEYKYKGEETCNKYVELASQGYLDVQIAKELGVSLQVFYQWEKKHEEFKNARAVGKERQEAWYLNCGQEMVDGKNSKGQFNAWRWFMKNKFGYTDDESVNLGVDNVVKVEFVSMNNQQDNKSE